MSSSIAILDRKLVGYWGEKDRSNLLTNLLTAPIQILSEIPTGISASGLDHGCWVRLKDSGLILGREPFGLAPLYWTEIDSTIWFASHVQLLLPLISQPQIDVAGFYGYSCFSYLPIPLTPIKGIQSVPAGVELFWAVGTLQPVTVACNQWQQAPEQINDEDVAVKQLQDLLQAAIER